MANLWSLHVYQAELSHQAELSILDAADIDLIIESLCVSQSDCLLCVCVCVCVCLFFNVLILVYTCTMSL